MKTGVWVKFRQKRGKNWSAPFWRKSKSEKTARNLERGWNSGGNPYDKIKILSIKKVKPKGLRKDKYGTYR